MGDFLSYSSSFLCQFLVSLVNVETSQVIFFPPSHKAREAPSEALRGILEISRSYQGHHAASCAPYYAWSVQE